MSEIICGKNNVLEALKSGREINRVLLAQGLDYGFVSGIKQLCRDNGVVCMDVPKQKLEKLAGADNRGVVAELAAVDYAEVEDILALAAERGEPPFVILLDDVEDPHNLGAVIRTALCAGAHGVVIPKRRAAALNQTVSRVSSGAVEYLPVARVANLPQTVEKLKKAGVWVAAADMKGKPLWQSDLSGPIALVMGSEGKGISPLLLSLCDFTVSIPMKGQLDSLNVSAAAAVLLYEVARTRA